MKLQIGRLGLDCDIDPPESGTWGTGKLDLTFHLSADNLEDLLAWRDQLYGLVNNPDEPVVPVIADPDTSITGFWQVTDVNAAVPSGALGYLDLTCTVSLARIASSSSPLIESVMTQALRPNFASVVTPEFWQAIPAGAEAYSLPLAAVTRMSESGDVSFFSDAMLADNNVRWIEEAADHYDGAATIEVGACDDPINTGTAAPMPPVSTYYPVVGRQLPNATYGWRISNGLIRLRPIYSSDTPGVMLEAWTGSRWSTPWLFEMAVYRPLSGVVTTYTQSLRSVSIIRNSPEAVTVKLGITNDAHRRSELTLTLRRGSYYVECYRTEQMFGFFSDHPAILRLPSGSASALTSAGVQASSADGDGMKWGIIQADNGTGDTTRGMVYTADPQITQDFAIMLTPSSPLATPWDLANQYMACGGETVRVVGQ